MKKLRFAPGKGNSKLIVLYNSRLDIRDAISVSDHCISTKSSLSETLTACLHLSCRTLC